MNERLRTVVKWIIGQGMAANQADIAFKLGINKTYLSQLVIGNKIIAQKFIDNLCSKFPEVNPDYLANGSGNVSNLKTVENKNNIEILMAEIEGLRKEVTELLNLLAQIKVKEQFN